MSNDKMIVLAALLALVAVQISFAQDNDILEQTQNLSSEALSARSSLLEARSIIEEMENAGFSTARAQDTFQTALVLYEGQISIEAQGKTGNYADIVDKAAEIEDIRNRAFAIQDGLVVLKQAIEDKKKLIDIAEPQRLYEEALIEFKSERYENAEQKIDESYKSINELERAKSRTGVLIEASKTLSQRLIEAWKEILVAIAIISLVVFVGQNFLYRKLIDTKIRMLELEKKTIEGLVQKTQNDYYNKGKLSEISYHIKIKKYGELIRDINRRLPLLREAKEKKGNLLPSRRIKKR